MTLDGADLVHIGCGAGFAGDRFDAALPLLASLARRRGPKYLMYEVLGERTLAIAQRLKREDPEAGASPYLEKYLRLSLAPAQAAGVRIVTNMGAANPLAAARRTAALARELGVSGLRVAAVTGDDLTAVMTPDEITAAPTMEGVALGGRPIVAANAYLGARPIAQALGEGADVVLVGRTTDSALALGPLIHEFGWAEDDWDRLAAGVVAGHLLECGAQITGAYFADPGFKDVPDLAHVGFPIAEIGSAGEIVLTKPEDTGGLVSPATVTEQLLYEVHDPGAYLTPDVIVDMREIGLEQVGPHRVALSDVRGRPAPPTLKATVCVDDGWMSESELTYAGINALSRAELAASVVTQRLAQLGVEAARRIEIMGTGAVHDGGDAARRRARDLPRDGEYRLRVAAKAPARETVQRVADEVLSLYCSGPAAGGGNRTQVTPQLATASILTPRERVEAATRVEVFEA